MTIKDHKPAAKSRAELEALLVADVRVMTTEADVISGMFGHTHTLGPNDLPALLHIMVAENSGKPLTQARLRERIGLSAPAVTYLVDRMIEADHIRREPDPADRRKAILRYQPQGTQVARSFFGSLGLHTRAAMADLADGDLAAAHRVLRAFIDAMQTFADSATQKSG